MRALPRHSRYAHFGVPEMNLRIRDITNETDTRAEQPERPSLTLPPRKHADYPPPKVLRWEPSNWIKPPSEERLRARR